MSCVYYCNLLRAEAALTHATVMHHCCSNGLADDPQAADRCHGQLLQALLAEKPVAKQGEQQYLQDTLQVCIFLFVDVLVKLQPTSKCQQVLFLLLFSFLLPMLLQEVLAAKPFSSTAALPSTAVVPLTAASPSTAVVPLTAALPWLGLK